MRGSPGRRSRRCCTRPRVAGFKSIGERRGSCWRWKPACRRGNELDVGQQRLIEITARSVCAAMRVAVGLARLSGC